MMKKVVIFAILFGVTFPAMALWGLFGYVYPASTLPNSFYKGKCNFEIAITVGDSSYLPINRFGVSADGMDMILETLKQFKELHKDWDFPPGCWSIRERQDVGKSTEWCYAPKDDKDAQGRAYVFGLNVDHRPKEPVAPAVAESAVK